MVRSAAGARRRPRRPQGRRDHGVGPPAAIAAKRATSTIPIVFSIGGDPVELGLVASLARPGGNITGVTFLTAELTPKLVELISELIPQARVIALMVNPNPNNERYIEGGQEAARAKQVRLQIVKATTEGEIDAAFATLAQLQAGALVVVGDPFFSGRREQFAALASRYAIPAIYGSLEFVEAGGLLSYGASFPSAFRQPGAHVGRILNGAKPADLPVEQSSKFELGVNLKTARALGLTVPQSPLARADVVID